FAYDSHQGEFERDSAGELIIDSRGRPYRQWREHIQRPEDIWQEIVAAASMPGSTSAPRLQPIETRLLMLQTGMRAAMGLKLTAPDLGTLEQARELLQRALTEAPGVAASTLNAERLVGKPWLEIHIDRERIARYGLSVNQVQNTIAAAIGGVEVGRTLEGRERYSISVRYPRELRQTPEQMQQVRVSTPNGAQIPLGQLADIRMVQGPEMIRTENTFLTSYITFGGEPGWAEVGVVEAVSDYLNSQLNSGELHLPAGVSYSFAGNFENQQRAAATLMLVIPLALVLIFMLLYLQFRAVSTALIVFSGVAVAWAGGFILLYLYGQSWFGNFSLLGVNMRELFQLQPVNLSIAVWVGFLALFGIAVDDGVVMGTYLKQHFAHSSGGNRRDIRQKTLQAAQRRVRPCLMTSATTILALLPVLTATGRGADLMIPMAIPTVGGLSFVLLSMFVVPVLYAWVEERKYTS
ncbi:MAG TPA: efflux RND transporter permease subunit, partial [Marinobacter sp.]|nr:efflux RND transporter permease subunit [Marinobacter sp.]